MSNGDSDFDQEQETPVSEGTKFTVDLRGIELTREQSQAMQSEIVSVIMERIGNTNPPETVWFYRRIVNPTISVVAGDDQPHE